SSDDVCIGRADARLHGRDLAALDKHVGLLEVSECAVEGKHAASLDQDRSSRCGRAARLLCGSGLPTRADHGCGSSCGCGRTAEKLAARGRRIACAAKAGRVAAVQVRHGILPEVAVSVTEDATPVEGARPARTPGTRRRPGRRATRGRALGSRVLTRTGAEVLACDCGDGNSDATIRLSPQKITPGAPVRINTFRLSFP